MNLENDTFFETFGTSGTDQMLIQENTLKSISHV